jgi:short subunit dehydrogenase-like uncharacterized protein
MIYGANGYTGRLIARLARERGLRPTLAGRSSGRVEPLARELGCECRAFELAADALETNLRGMQLVLNCAGPFVRTAPAMIEACLARRVHYLDITGEIDVIEHAASLDSAARAAGVLLMPAVGFDVVPSDCLAKALAERLPSATRLTLAFSDSGGVSPGTAKTVLLGAGQGGRVRASGRIEPVPVAWKSREIPFADQARWAMTVPWGDVASAFYSTGIPSIETYFAMPQRAIQRIRRMHWMLRALEFPPLAWLLTQAIHYGVRGPSEKQRTASRAQFWGEVADQAGQRVEGTLETPGGYQLTPTAALECVARVLAGQAPPGFCTPAKAFGSQLITAIPGTALNVPARRASPPAA